MKSYLIDTNYFLRFILDDNVGQRKKVRQLFEDGLHGKADLYSTIPVFFELYWVLSSFYDKNKSECARVLQLVLQLPFITFENRRILAFALQVYKKHNVDLEDCYNIALYSSGTFDSFATFDKKALRMAKTLQQ